MEGLNLFGDPAVGIADEFVRDDMAPEHDSYHSMEEEKEGRLFVFIYVHWKVRFKNKVWLGSFLSLIIGFIYSMLELFDVFPTVTQNHIIQLMNQVLTFLGLIGVIVDPTTAGIGDSERAMEYTEPWDDNVNK